MPHTTARPRVTGAPRLFFALVLASAISACASVHAVPADGVPGPGRDGFVLTSEDILQSGARDAMEAVERAPTHLNIQRVRNGDPARITHRGVSSFVLSPEILVIVDGSRVSTSVSHLESIPAQSIRFIQILSAREAGLRWGAEAGSGVILVMTSARD